MRAAHLGRRVVMTTPTDRATGTPSLTTRRVLRNSRLVVPPWPASGSAVASATRQRVSPCAHSCQAIPASTLDSVACVARDRIGTRQVAPSAWLLRGDRLS
jgi:hypothetical protein